MTTLFDLSDEIQLIDQAQDQYGVEVEDFFYLCQTCGMIAAICSVFEIERGEKGCVVTAFGKTALHEIEIREDRLLLNSKALDDTNILVERFYAGPSSNPQSWAGAVKHIYKAERAILQMIDFAGRLRSEWNEYLRIRGDRLGF